MPRVFVSHMFPEEVCDNVELGVCGIVIIADLVERFLERGCTHVCCDGFPHLGEMSSLDHDRERVIGHELSYPAFSSVSSGCYFTPMTGEHADKIDTNNPRLSVFKEVRRDHFVRPARRSKDHR